MFSMLLRQNNGLQRDIKVNFEAFWQLEIFDFEIVKYLNLSKCLYLRRLIDKPSIKLTDTCSLRSPTMYQ